MRRLAGLASLTLALVLCLGIAAQAELNRKGDLIVSFQGEIKPSELPRTKPAPVSVRVAGNVKSTKGRRLPQLRKISGAIHRKSSHPAVGDVVSCAISARGAWRITNSSGGRLAREKTSASSDPSGDTVTVCPPFSVVIRSLAPPFTGIR